MAAAATLVPVELSWWTKAAVFIGAAVSLARALPRHAWLRSADAITAIELDDDDAVVYRHDGRSEHARLLASTYVSPYLTVLNLRIAGNIFAQHVIVVPDNVEPDAFRRLRLWLRWGYSER